MSGWASLGLLVHSALLVCMAWRLGNLLNTATEHEGNLGYLVDELRDLVEGLRHDRSDNAPPDARPRPEHDAVARTHRGRAQVSTPARRHQTPKEQMALIERLDPNYVPPPQPDYDDVPVCCKACGRIDGDITEWICPDCEALNRGEQEVEGAL